MNAKTTLAILTAALALPLLAACGQKKDEATRMSDATPPPATAPAAPDQDKAGTLPPPVSTMPPATAHDQAPGTPPEAEKNPQ